MPATKGLADFVRARLADIEADGGVGCEGYGEYEGCKAQSELLARLLDAVGAIVEDHAAPGDQLDDHAVRRCGPLVRQRLGVAILTLRLIARCWREHPDFRPVWLEEP